MSAADPLERESGRRGRKLGEVLAERIEEEIISAGWPVGTVLGSEAELTARYGVSRAVFREAMRIVDHHGVAEMRRGPGGGLVVVEPDLGAVVRTVSLHLQHLGIDRSQVAETRLALELSCVRAAAERIDDTGRQTIREFLATEYDAILHGRESGRASDDLPSNDFHLLVAELTGNPAMHLFVETLSRVTSQQAPRSSRLAETAKEVHRVHSRIAEAIVAGDADLAERRMRVHIEALIDFMRPSGKASGRSRDNRTAVHV